MDVQVEELSALTKKLTITLPADTVQPRLNEAYDKLKREVRLKGFRRGKVPRNVIIKYYKGQVEGETGEKLVQENYFDAVEKEKVDPITHPEIKDIAYNDDGSFTFIAEVDIRPEFELGEYKGLTLVKTPVEVGEEDVEKELASIQKSIAPLRLVEGRAAEKGDTVTVDFQGFYNGTAMAQVKQDDYSFEIGSGAMGEEFEEKLVGMNKDEEKVHEVDFPESHPNPLLKGKNVEFHVKVKEIKEKDLPALDDEFVKKVDENCATLEELKSSIQQRLTSEKEAEAESAVTDNLVEKLLETHDFAVPGRLVAFEIEQMIKQTEKQFEQMGLSLEAAGISRETLAEQNAPIATKRVRGDFILKKIAEVEEIKVEDEDMDRGFKRIGDRYNMSVAQVKGFFKNRDDLLPFMNELLNEKILNFLKENAVFVDAEEKQADENEGVEENRE